MRQKIFHQTIVLLLAGLSAVYCLADNISYTYDKNGRLKTQTNALGQTQTYTYDSLGRIVNRQAPKNQASDSQGPSINLSYHSNDQLTQVNDARGLITRYQYNDFGELIKLQSPDTGIENNQYISTGNLKNNTDANNYQTHIIYDQNQRINRIVHADSIITLNYGKTGAVTGQLISATDTLSKTSLVWDYNAFGEVIKKTQRTCCGTDLAVVYGYDPAGRMVSITYPSGQQLQIIYDSASKSVSHINYNNQLIASNIQLTPLGQLRSLQLGNGVNHQRTFDNQGRLQSYSLGGQVHTLNYDKADRIISISNKNASQQFGYDNQDRLTSYKNGEDRENYQYDNNHNRVGIERDGVKQTIAIVSNSNRLANTGYDANGNLLKDNQRAYRYTSNNQLAQLDANAVTTEYSYNALGQRIIKKNSHEQTYFLYDEAGQLLGEYDQNGNVKAEHLWLGNIPIATITFNSQNQPNIYYIETDQLHTPRLITDSSKKTVWQWQSDPFGQQLPTGSLTYNLRFPGQYFDKESGLHYNYFRNYDPASGRYIQSDPIGLEGGINTYMYVRGNPINLSDLFGLKVIIATDAGDLEKIITNMKEKSPEFKDIYQKVNALNHEIRIKFASDRDGVKAGQGEESAFFSLIWGPQYLIKIEKYVNDWYCAGADGKPFLIDRQRVIAHELIHPYLRYVENDMRAPNTKGLEYSVIELENKIMKEINPSSLLRNPNDNRLSKDPTKLLKKKK